MSCVGSEPAEAQAPAKAKVKVTFASGSIEVMMPSGRRREPGRPAVACLPGGHPDTP